MAVPSSKSSFTVHTYLLNISCWVNKNIKIKIANVKWEQNILLLYKVFSASCISFWITFLGGSVLTLIYFISCLYLHNYLCKGVVLSVSLCALVFPLLSMGDIFQAPQWMSETTDSTEPCMYYVFFLYVHNFDKV